MTRQAPVNHPKELKRTAPGITAAVLLVLFILAPTLARPFPGGLRHMVTTLDDGGTGSLRAVLSAAAPGDTIVFEEGLDGTITLGSPLPDTRSVSFENSRNITLFQRSGSGSHVIRFLNNTQVSGPFQAGISGSGTGTYYGIRAEGAITLETLSMDIDIATLGTRAYGIGSENSGDISFTDFSGRMSVRAEDGFAFGMYSDNDLSFNSFSGRLTASTGEYFSFGLHADNDIRFDTLSGSVAAQAEGPFAIGVYASGQLAGKSSAQGLISGSISAVANGTAVAVGASTGMDIKITGTLTARDISGGGQAWAIAAGTPGYPGMAPWYQGGNYDDNVVLGDGASLVGDIDLGGGTNTLALEGSGRLLGNVENIGTMAMDGPGTWISTGRMSVQDLAVNSGILDLASGSSHSVDGSLSVGDGAVLKLQIHRTDQPVMAVAGQADNRGNVNFSLHTHVPSGTTFTVLNSAGLTGAGTYSTSSPVLEIHRGSQAVTATKKKYTVIPLKTPNARLMAKALEKGAPSATGDMAVVLAGLDSAATMDEFEDCLNQLGPRTLSGISAVTMDMSRLFFSSAMARMAQLRHAGQYLARKTTMDPDDPDTWPLLASAGELAGILYDPGRSGGQGLHIQAMGQTGHTDSRDGFTGYDTTTAALAGGIDRIFSYGPFDKNVLGGISLGVADTRVLYRDTGNSNADMTTFSLGVYGSFFDRNWYLDTTLAGAYSEYNLSRAVTFLGRRAVSDPTGYTLSAKTKGGYTFETGMFGITPLVSLEFTRFHQSGYTETGASGANLRVDTMDETSFKTGLGIQLDRSVPAEFGLVIQKISLGWEHELLSPERQVNTGLAGMPGLVYTSVLNPPDRDALVLEAGVTSVIESKTALSLTYRGKVSEHSGSHCLIGDMKILF